MQLFVDCDGVLADFDTHYENHFGIRACTTTDNVDWDLVRVVKDFYLSIPPMPDMQALWDRIKRHRPIVLTGVPRAVPEATANKHEWVRRHIGEDIEVRCCRSREKCLHAAPGDVLIDDWEKYRNLWVDAGGRWITHRNAAATAEELTLLGL